MAYGLLGREAFGWTDGCGLSPECGDRTGRMPRRLREDHATVCLRYSSRYSLHLLSSEGGAGDGVTLLALREPTLL
jgi:hypothetical protein